MRWQSDKIHALFILCCFHYVSAWIIVISFITAHKRSLEQGNIFTGVCLSTGEGVSLKQTPLDRHPLDRDPPVQRFPSPNRDPLGRDPHTVKSRPTGMHFCSLICSLMCCFVYLSQAQVLVWLATTSGRTWKKYTLWPRVVLWIYWKITKPGKTCRSVTDCVSKLTPLPNHKVLRTKNCLYFT